ncbi:LRR receptor-like serine/threonine-protein kinase [Dorcoceras hygrometricum]|uniref:LRR receptor-like serine/threonine-protein kinase n=1 Tax=Dorcoceras hygrometricum TaxID=472368 RepID=A0A2Z7BN25_9LAMI|nr:LRR receptor-like serine/threonine-protein kinase [Dorcoceras hygrometricum]
MVKGKGIQVVEIELQESTVRNKHVIDIVYGTDDFGWSSTRGRCIFHCWRGLNCSRAYPTIPQEDGFCCTHFRGMSTVSSRDLNARIDDFEGVRRSKLDQIRSELVQIDCELKKRIVADQKRACSNQLRTEEVRL